MTSDWFTAMALAGLASLASTALGCRGDSADTAPIVRRTPAARVALDAGGAAVSPKTRSATTPVATAPSGEFHLDEGGARRSKRRSGPAGTGRTLHLTLRSTPTGATAAVDGRVVGTTPTYWEGPANGRAREFTFVHAGYAMARYRFVATSDGVVHGTLTKVVIETSDAGVAPPSNHR